MCSSLAPGGTPVKATLEDLEGKQATGLMTTTDLVGERDEETMACQGATCSGYGARGTSVRVAVLGQGIRFRVKQQDENTKSART